MKLKYLFFIALLSLLMPGCSKERVYENIYEGMQQREQIVNPPDDPVPPKHPSYDEYKREREEILKDGSGEP